MNRDLEKLARLLGVTDVHPIGTAHRVVGHRIRRDQAEGLLTNLPPLSVIGSEGAGGASDPLVLPPGIARQFDAIHFPESGVIEWRHIPDRALRVAGGEERACLATYDEGHTAYTRIAEPGAIGVVEAGGVAVVIEREDDAWMIGLVEMVDAPSRELVTTWLERECTDAALRAALRARLDDSPWSRLAVSAVLVAAQPPVRATSASTTEGLPFRPTDWSAASPSAVGWFAGLSALSVSRLRDYVAGCAEIKRLKPSEFPDGVLPHPVQAAIDWWQELRLWRADLAALAMVLRVHCRAPVADIERDGASLDGWIEENVPERSRPETDPSQLLRACARLDPGAWWVDEPW